MHSFTFNSGLCVLTNIELLFDLYAILSALYAYTSSLRCFWVIDKQERSVVYYKKQPSPMFNSHPTDYEDVSKMLHKLLKDFIK